jgi:hypothetical protein
MIQDSALVETAPLPSSPSLTIAGGATGMLGSACRLAVSEVTPTEATVIFDTAGQASIRQTVAPGELLLACAGFYRVAKIVPITAGAGLGSSAHAVVIESTPVVVPGISLKTDGLWLSQRGSLYLGPGKSELSELAITGDKATFKVGPRSGAASKVSTEVLSGTTVQIDKARYGVAKVVAKDPARGLTGWIELVPLP